MPERSRAPRPSHLSAAPDPDAAPEPGALLDATAPGAAPDGPEAGPGLGLWHVSVTFAGPPAPRAQLHAALLRLVAAQPFLASVRYGDDRAQVTYWDEAEDVDDAAALALRLWAEHRRAADLPDWRAVGIEVVDRRTLHARGEAVPAPSALGEVRPW